MKHLLYVCLDGLGDDPNPVLDGRTPLEAAATPNLDGLAVQGRTGTVVHFAKVDSGTCSPVSGDLM